MKLIIDVSDIYYEECKRKAKTSIGICTKIANATPFDSVIEDIKKERYNQGFVDGYKNSYNRGHAVIEDIKAEIDDLDVSDLGKMGIITAIFEIIDKHMRGET